MKHTNKGIIIAITIIGIWGLSISTLLSFDMVRLSFTLIPVGMLFQTFLYTGLFITAHDAMHGSVCPARPRLNNFLGSVTVRLYALFSYSKLLDKHWEHHRTPASNSDPDYHDGEHSGYIMWYLRFMKEYLSWQQLIGMAIVFQLLKYGLGIPTLNLILFWISPALLSTFQLFYFGTYLPHRRPKEGYDNPHRTQSNAYSVFWSFITCYHFGYHWEHHEFPYIPWWELPEARKFGKYSQSS